MRRREKEEEELIIVQLTSPFSPLPSPE